MICPVCLQRWAEFSPEDYIIDCPAPPGQGIIAKSDLSHPRRMVVFNDDDIKYCGCCDADAHWGIKDDHERRETIAKCWEIIHTRLVQGETILQIMTDPCGDALVQRILWNMRRKEEKKVYDPLSPKDPMNPSDPLNGG